MCQELSMDSCHSSTIHAQDVAILTLASRPLATLLDSSSVGRKRVARGWKLKRKPGMVTKPARANLKVGQILIDRIEDHAFLLQ